MRGLAAAALVVAACAPSSGEVKLARASVYKVNLSACRDAVVQALREDYRHVFIYDGEPIRVASDWRTISVTNEGDAELFLIGAAVAVKDGACEVAIDGVGGHLTHGMTVVPLYAHGADDEPGWVGARIDRAYTRVYERLHGAAVPAKPVDASPVEDWLRKRPRPQGTLPSF